MTLSGKAASIDLRVFSALLIFCFALSGWPPDPIPGPDFTVAVIPDPQYYASIYPAVYTDQMQWIADNRAERNIVFVASLGDNVDLASDLRQWSNADAAYRILDAAGVPYGLSVGNHDGAPAATQNFNFYFGADRFARQPTYGGHYGDDNDNSYALFEASGLKFIVIFIEYDDGMTSADHPVLAWARRLLQEFSDRRGIVVSHNLLESGSSNAFSSQGRTIYDALKGSRNLFLLLGGHWDVAARRSDTYQGSTIHTLRSDYQFQEDFKSGYLRILRFSPVRNRIYVSTYSPTQKKFHPDRRGNSFSLIYDMGGAGSLGIGRRSEARSDGSCPAKLMRLLSPGAAEPVGCIPR
jgi:calcineurin-like phosphoesterase family protein